MNKVYIYLVVLEVVLLYKKILIAYGYILYIGVKWYSSNRSTFFINFCSIVMYIIYGRCTQLHYT